MSKNSYISNKRHTINSVLARCERSESGCLLWKGSTNGRGYPYLSFQGQKGRGNRLLWAHLNGPIPEGMVIMHICDEPRCLNMNHLKLGTMKDNMRDASEKKRFPGQKKTHCPRGHKYDTSNTKIHDGKRSCKSCSREHMREINGFNFGKHRSAKSKYFGVQKDRNKWRARLTYEFTTHEGGTFKTEEEAALAYNRLVLRVCPDHKPLNEILEPA